MTKLPPVLARAMADDNLSAYEVALLCHYMSKPPVQTLSYAAMCLKSSHTRLSRARKLLVAGGYVKLAKRHKWIFVVVQDE